ncbi:ABCB family ABC transporter ATP-binding protein/permease [Camelimonas lactis]|uniref:ATP-binding cassette subfamily B protein n=1 Tax=Camelimonas lactis TaxID=659006 RepID=A0A4V2RX60_9HYPH|nr:ABC transporter ATP-binding protein/permease [Camelimonas lactis]TCO12011.1 ATP-binding cassette subfamily B protein [Camelimonas lactis]
MPRGFGRNTGALPAPDPSVSSGDNGGLLGAARRLAPYVWPPADRGDLRLRIYASTVLILAAKLVTIGMPYAYKWATDALAGDQPLAPGSSLAWLWQAPLALTLLYGLTRIAIAVLTQMRDAIFATVTMAAVRRLARDTFTHMNQLSLRFHLERRMGGLTRVLERGRTGVQELSRLFVLQLLPTIVEFALVLAVLTLEFDWRYALIVIAMVSAYILYTFVATNWRIAIRKRINESDNLVQTRAVDALLNFETVKYFGAEAREAKRYDESMARYEHNSVRSYVSLAVLNAGQVVIFTLGLTAAMALAVHDIRAGRTTIGGFVMINAMLIQLSIPLNFMGMIYREVKQSLLDIGQMFAVLDQAPEIRDAPDAKPLAVTGGAVRFENVRFAYHPDRQILKGVSFEAPAGRTLAIVGASGAGKSTLSRLLFRFYEPTSGRILIDGHDIAAVTQDSLRAAIGMVPQDTVLFNDTIAYNIRYGRWDATDDEVREAARLAQLAPVVAAMPAGYDTMVGERGLKLSGGEKQRVAIARTILKAPPILVLDEATSALDSFTEREIQDALAAVSRGRTTLVIAHRLSTIVNADEIMVMDHGEVVERGTHDALLAAGGVYAGLWNRQRRAEQALQTLKETGEEEMAVGARAAG